MKVEPSISLNGHSENTQSYSKNNNISKYRINLISMPHSYTLSNSIPYMGILNISAELRKKGNFVNQEHLGIIIENHNLMDNRIDIDKLINCKYPKEEENIILELILSRIDYLNFDITGAKTDFPSLNFTLKILKLIKERTGSIIVINGVSKELSKSTMIDFQFVDYILYGGDASKSIQKICEFEFGRKINKSDIPNIMYRDQSGKIKLTQYKEVKDISEVSEPYLNKKYINLFKNHRVNNGIFIMPYYFNKGCIYKCEFCRPYKISDKFQTKRFPRVINELKSLSSKYKTDSFMFLNNLINPSAVYFDKFCDSLQESSMNILWSDSARPANLNKGLLEKARQNGCICLVFGVETLSNSLLDKMRKGTNYSEIKKVLMDSSNAGIWNHINLMAGFPNESKEDISLTLSRIEEIIPFIDSYNFAQFQLAPYLKMFYHPDDYNIIKKETKNQIMNLEKSFGFNEVSGLSWEEKCNNADMYKNKLEKIWSKCKKHEREITPSELFFPYKKYKEKTKVIDWFDQKKTVKIG